MPKVDITFAVVGGRDAETAVNGLDNSLQRLRTTAGQTSKELRTKASAAGAATMSLRDLRQTTSGLLATMAMGQPAIAGMVFTLTQFTQGLSGLPPAAKLAGAGLVSLGVVMFAQIQRAEELRERQLALNRAFAETDMSGLRNQMRETSIEMDKAVSAQQTWLGSLIDLGRRAIGLPTRSEAANEALEASRGTLEQLLPQEQRLNDIRYQRAHGNLAIEESERRLQRLEAADSLTVGDISGFVRSAREQIQQLRNLAEEELLIDAYRAQEKARVRNASEAEIDMISREYGHKRALLAQETEDRIDKILHDAAQKRKELQRRAIQEATTLQRQAADAEIAGIQTMVEAERVLRTARADLEVRSIAEIARLEAARADEAIRDEHLAAREIISVRQRQYDKVKGLLDVSLQQSLISERAYRTQSLQLSRELIQGKLQALQQYQQALITQLRQAQAAEEAAAQRIKQITQQEPAMQRQTRDTLASIKEADLDPLEQVRRQFDRYQDDILAPTSSSPEDRIAETQRALQGIAGLVGQIVPLTREMKSNLGTLDGLKGEDFISSPGQVSTAWRQFFAQAQTSQKADADKLLSSMRMMADEIVTIQGQAMREQKEQATDAYTTARTQVDTYRSSLVDTTTEMVDLNQALIEMQQTAAQEILIEARIDDQATEPLRGISDLIKDIPAQIRMQVQVDVTQAWAGSGGGSVARGGSGGTLSWQDYFTSGAVADAFRELESVFLGGGAFDDIAEGGFPGGLDLGGGDPGYFVGEYARGGIVPQTGYALVHAGEEVLTPTQRARATEQSTAIHSPISIVVHGSQEDPGVLSRRIARDVSRELARLDKLGRLPARAN